MYFEGVKCFHYLTEIADERTPSVSIELTESIVELEKESEDENGAE